MVANCALYWCAAMALFAARSVGFSASGLVFLSTWGSLIQTALLPLKLCGLTLIPKFFTPGGGAATSKSAAKPAAAKAAAAKGAKKPSAAKTPAKAASVTPSEPAPQVNLNKMPQAADGYKYDQWGRLIVA